MKKYISILLLFLLSTALFAQTNQAAIKWKNDIAQYDREDKTNPPPKHAIEFIGSSTIRFWKTLPQDFPGKPVFDRGFGGSQIDEATALADRLIFPYEPRIIVFYSGDNDLAAGKSPERVFADFQKFVKTVHEHLPDTVIDVISIKPCQSRWKLKDKVMTVNADIKAMHDPKLHYIDIVPLMLDEDGKPKADMFKPDGLHPSQKCYEQWAEKIRPYLD
ncbi:MAG TPA: GDSL-type esterase/lipase family protein [Verrucomicrobiae bacterium]|nr:GDSL-type esterase/lipase family protein [Verrucomicrobiae bacterium]